MVGTSNSSLMGCEVQVTASGYVPAVRTITHTTMLGTVDVGVLTLRRVALSEETSIRATSLLAPGSARKEFEKGLTELQQNHSELGIQHLEKAVSQYDRFAAAWYELGKVYAANSPVRARHAFEKAIAADSHFAEPYVRLAGLQLGSSDHLGAIESASKALQIEPRNKLAHFIRAAANFNLDRIDEAESNARQAERYSEGSLPQLHALMASILLKKEDYPNALREMQAYLKEDPQGLYAEQIKRNLEQLISAGIHQEQ